MSTDRLPRIATPLLLSAAILVSFRYQKSMQPIELPAAEQPARPLSEVQAAYERALAPGAPGFERGSKTAPVTILELSDFGCPYCGRFARETYPQLVSEFVNRGIVRWRHVQFTLGIFPTSRDAARAAGCAAEQGSDAAVRMHDLLFGDQDSWKGAADVASSFRTYARDAQLNVSRFSACYESSAADQRVADANRLADELGVRATPTFFINGTRVEGALPAEEFRAVINQLVQENTLQ